ncbi:phage tail tape measure protein [Tsukamurella tyrosinosolvens]|uniref:aggregation-promoting factor C-terminal-like domain-containing protein n=1 Tax=Tsukamurella tyrosinosolvens TaxID=57704 RepID=UPI0034623CA3
MTTIGTAVLQIIPSLDGVSNAVQGQLGFLPGMGRQAGQALGDGLASGVDAAARKVETATGKITAAQKKVEDSAGKVRVAEAQLQALRDRGVTDAGRLAAAEEKVAAAQRNLTGAERAHTTATNALTRAQEDLAQAERRASEAQDDGAQSGGRFSGAMGKMKDQAGGAVGNLKNLAVAAAGIGTAMDLATTAMDFEGATAKLNASLGATGPLAEEYGKNVATLWGKGFGESMDDVTKAVEAVATTMPVIGSEGEVSLDKAAERAMNFAKIFDTDVSEAVQNAEQLITNGLAKDSTEAMDLLTTAMQRVPASLRGELPEILGEYGKHFQTFGMSGQAAMGLIVDMAPQGKIALDKTGDAIKELSIRATDGSKSTSEAFKAIGVDADKMAGAIAKGGPGAQAAMQEIAKGLLTVQDPAARAQQAIALFGTPLEDLGVDKIPQFLTALSGTSESMTGFEGAIDRAGEELNDTAQSKLNAFGRSLQTNMIGALGSAAGYLDEHRGLLYTLGGALGAAALAYGALRTAAIASSVAQGVQAASTGAGTAAITANKIAMGAHLITTGAIKVATTTWTAAQWLLNAALSANPIGLIVVGIAALVAGIVLAYKNSETFRDIVAGAWNWIKEAALSVVSWFTDTAWPALQAVWEGIKAGWNTLVESAQAVWNGVKDKFDQMVNFVTGLPQRIRDGAGSMWDGIKDAFRSALNWVINAWNNFRLSWDFTIPVINKRVQLALDTPDLPLFDGGGWTGPGAKYDVAGVVHADEFVLSKAARSALEGANPGGLDFMNKTGRWPGYAEGGRVQTAEGLNPGADYLRTLIMKKWPEIKTIGGRRSEDGYGEHSSGNALDVMIPNYGSPEGKAIGDAVLAFLQQNAAALQLDGVIWQQASFGYGGSLTEGKPMDSRGSDTQNHLDHLHVILGKGRGEGAAPTEVPAGLDGAPAQSPAAAAAASMDAKPTDTKTDDKKTADEKPQTSTPAPSSGGGGSYPTSISGWAGFIGENFVGGQIKSLLSVFGIPDSPSWMKAGSQLIGGIKVSDKDGKSLFDGSNPFGGIAAAVDGKKPETKATAEAAGPGAALPITDAKATPDTKAVETLTSALSAPKADYKGGTPEIHDAVYKAFRDAGYDNSQWGDLVTLINRESAWNPEARNPSSDAYGLGQFLTQGNIDKYLGGQNRDVPVDKQGAAIMQYIKDRYGDPSKALAFHDANNWYADGGLVKPYLYDAGGLLPQGVSLVENRSGGPEPILTQDYWRTAKTAIDVATSMFQGQAGGQQKQLPQINYNIQARDTEDAFIRAQRQERERAAAKLSRF